MGPVRVGTKRLSGSVTLATAPGLGASSRRRGLMCARGFLPRARAAAARSATRCSYRRWRAAASASSRALACWRRASRPLGLARSAGSSSPRVGPCWRSSAWSVSAASRRIAATSSWSLTCVRLALLAALAATLVPSNATTPRRTSPAAAHNRSDSTRNPARACWWRTRNRAIVTCQGPGCRPAPGRRDPRGSGVGSAGRSAPRWRRRTAAPQAGSWGRRRGRARRPDRRAGMDPRSSWSTTSRMNQAR
jgi:hypothetical protein